MFTVKELINSLQEIEDKEQPIAYQYYLKEHLDWMDGNPDWNIQILNDWIGESFHNLFEDEPSSFYEEYGFVE